MKDTFEIGSTPNDETCQQVGPNYDSIKARAECRAYINQLKRVYGNEPIGCNLKITEHMHDAGLYHEVTVVFTDETDLHSDYIWGNLECGCERWDSAAKIELGID